jgi:hypothetical protein
MTIIEQNNKGNMTGPPLKNNCHMFFSPSALFQILILVAFILGEIGWEKRNLRAPLSLEFR